MMNQSNRINQTNMLGILAIIFFLSGMAALIYQVTWQRLLFTGFGVDITSITVIISIFMIGLGVGAYYGGRIADFYSKRILWIFCLFELLIGLFGAMSYWLITWLGQVLLHADLWGVALGNLTLLLLPTFGSVLCGFILFNYLTIPQTLWLAASVNLLISCSVFILYVRKS